jgi:PAS domain S-box-containing protein
MLLELQLGLLPWAEITAIAGALIVLFLRFIHVKLKKLLEQTTTNGGSSLRDQMNRIETYVQDLSLLVEAGHHLSPKPIFRTDSQGNFTWVNTAFTRLVGMGLDELRGLGWISAIDPADVQRVTVEWDIAVRDRRKFESVMQIMNSLSQQTKKVKIKAHPILKKDALLGYLGTIFLLEEIIDSGIE